MENLYGKLKDYSNQNYCPMHMPGHKRNTKLLGNKLPYDIDITEIDGFDDLHNPKGIIKNIEDKAKKIYRSKRSFVLINGSTCGLLAGIRSQVKPHDKILVSRNCHKSVYHAIELNFLNPIYLMPNINEFGMEEEISPSQVEKHFKENEDIKLVVITSPTYEGIISNIKEITKIAHKYNVPVLVDEAHGAHLKFDSILQEYEALNSGADIIIQSLHKTLPSLTQTAIMHIQGDLVKERDIETQLSIFETSSPSYILISSIEECLDIIEKEGSKLFEKYQKRLNEFYEKTNNLKKLKILGNVIDKNIIYDKGKIVIITANTNLTGKKLSQILREKYKIEVEMSSINYVIAMTSICDSKENFERLQLALAEIDKEIFMKEEAKQDYTIKIPKQAISINDAINSSKFEFINFKEAEGKISKEYLWVYPPGIPMITPGEVIDSLVIKKMENIMNSKIEIRTTYGNFPDIAIIEN